MKRSATPKPAEHSNAASNASSLSPMRAVQAQPGPSSEKPWWRHPIVIPLALGLGVHTGFMVYAKNAPKPTYNFDAVAATDLEIEHEIETEHAEDITPPQAPKDPSATDATAAPSNDDTETAATRANPTAPISKFSGPSPVMASTAEDASSNNTAPNGVSAPGPHVHEPDVTQDNYDSDSATFSATGADGKVYSMGNGTGIIADVGTSGPAAPTEAPKAARVGRDKANEVIGAAIKDKDNKLGMTLPAAGTVSSTVRDVVWSSSVPEKSKGTIVVQLGPDGKVVSVKVAGMAGGSSGDWDAIAANVKSALSAKSLTLTDEYKKGAIITINVDSHMQTPSGSDPDNPVKFGPTTTFDISDIGAKPIRQVRTQTNITAIK